MSTEIRPLYPVFQEAEPLPKRPSEDEFLAAQALGTGYATEFITVAEAAKIMAVSEMTVYRRLRSGVVKGTKIGRRYQVHEPSLREAMRPRDLSSEYKEQSR